MIGSNINFNLASISWINSFLTEVGSGNTHFERRLLLWAGIVIALLTLIVTALAVVFSFFGIDCQTVRLCQSKQPAIASLPTHPMTDVQQGWNGIASTEVVEQPKNLKRTPVHVQADADSFGKTAMPMQAQNNNPDEKPPAAVLQISQAPETPPSPGTSSDEEQIVVAPSSRSKRKKKRRAPVRSVLEIPASGTHHKPLLNYRKSACLYGKSQKLNKACLRDYMHK